jgi:hypothetical protein
MIVVRRDAQLLDVVGALRPASGFARRLHRWQQQCDQDTDDGDHDQQLNEREGHSPRLLACVHDMPPMEKDEKKDRNEQ